MIFEDFEKIIAVITDKYENISNKKLKKEEKNSDQAAKKSTRTISSYSNSKKSNGKIERPPLRKMNSHENMAERK